MLGKKLMMFFSAAMVVGALIICYIGLSVDQNNAVKLEEVNGK